MSGEVPRSATAAREIMILRDAVEADLPAVVEIYNAAIASRSATAQLEPVTIEHCRDWLNGPYPFWVAQIGGRVAGWLNLKPFLTRGAYRGTAELSVYVDEKFRRRGVAKRLVQEALTRAPQLKISALVGLIFGDNERSLRLFEHFGFERWGVLPRIAHVDANERDLVITGLQCGTQNHIPPTVDRDLPRPIPFELMQTLIELRQQPIHGQLEKIRAKYSMLHLDVLLLTYHFAKTCPGEILEIGAFLGGATMAAALGVRASATRKKLITIEPGGSLKHSRVGSRDIWRDFGRNLRKQRLSDVVTAIKGYSFEPATIAAVHEALGSDEIRLLIIDADGAVKRHLACYEDKVADNCWIVIDDYFGPQENIKVEATRKDVDALVDAGRLEPLGFYGWGTWIGRWRSEPTRKLDNR
jgi:L-amino acid N-acyltransferase YncA/predicted O-methyltransferase YrrM